MANTLLELHIGGMHCSACSSRVERVLRNLQGVKDAHVHLATGKAQIHIHDQQVSMSHIVQAIEKIGFSVKPFHTTQANEDQKEEEKTLLISFIFSAIFTIPLVWASLAHVQWAAFIPVPTLLKNPFVQCGLAIPIQFVIGFPFYERAFRGIRSGYANMDVLVVLSTSTAFFYSHYVTFSSLPSALRGEEMMLYYETSAMIITFILLGRFLEAKTTTRTAQGMKELYNLQKKTATITSRGMQKKVPIEILQQGDMIIVKPGERVPIDGRVIEGSSMIDESLLTGESTPIQIEINHPVYAGTINHDGLIKVQVTKKDADTVLSHIIQIVEKAQLSKPEIQRIADRVVHLFVPVIIFIAGITFVLSYIMLEPGIMDKAVEKSIAVLIIACPCALGLATPTSIIAGSGRAAQLGILFKEGTFLELLGKQKTIVLDKTGTLTAGKPVITDMYIERGSHEEFLTTIGAVENHSNHPLAQAILTEVDARQYQLKSAIHIEALPGFGVKGIVEDKNVLIVNRRYVQEKGLFLPMRIHNKMKILKQEGKTMILIYIQSIFSGMIATDDSLKPSATQEVLRMRKQGLDVYMLTGDHQQRAMNIANTVGIEHVQAEITPEEKAAFITHLQDNGNGVIMVGDGINDAPALAVADVGITLATGEDISIEAGDVTIMSGDIQKIHQAISISQRTMRNIKQNISWAFFYNGITIPFAMFGFLAPWIAAAAMALSSISVVLNALRLYHIRL